MANGDIPLYPISNAPNYPTASDITNSLRKARLTETNLSVEHIEMLLNVLVLDGKIEKVFSAQYLPVRFLTRHRYHRLVPRCGIRTH